MMNPAKTKAVSVPRRPIYYKDVTMPQSLNPEVMEALAREGDVDEGMDFIQHWHMSTIRKQIREDDDWGTGVEGLMREGGRIPALTRRTKSLEYEERKGSDDWYVELDVRNFPLTHPRRTLTLPPVLSVLRSDSSAEPWRDRRHLRIRKMPQVLSNPRLPQELAGIGHVDLGIW